eukprot:CAMPEP_0171559104 /NCGR_PEP_ID=MMETSP0960-20121227/12560_1 /TAXON_ID=87120 /ORGANISM="Aurantiochytrium limacinum, Strain ATCCMYA-1381" /LENGTH=451 /DNA_ID=CAMNT_0012110365 /DNA_START=347 /DNA_END=1698 /DNA_ORIENTATION=-
MDDHSSMIVPLWFGEETVVIIDATLTHALVHTLVRAFKPQVFDAGIEAIVRHSSLTNVDRHLGIETEACREALLHHGLNTSAQFGDDVHDGLYGDYDTTSVSSEVSKVVVPRKVDWSKFAVSERDRLKSSTVTRIGRSSVLVIRTAAQLSLATALLLLLFGSVVTGTSAALDFASTVRDTYCEEVFRPRKFFRRKHDEFYSSLENALATPDTMYVDMKTTLAQIVGAAAVGLLVTSSTQMSLLNLNVYAFLPYTHRVLKGFALNWDEYTTYPALKTLQYLASTGFDHDDPSTWVLSVGPLSFQFLQLLTRQIDGITRSAQGTKREDLLLRAVLIVASVLLYGSALRAIFLQNFSEDNREVNTSIDNVGVYSARLERLRHTFISLEAGLRAIDIATDQDADEKQWLWSVRDVCMSIAQDFAEVSFPHVSALTYATGRAQRAAREFNNLWTVP